MPVCQKLNKPCLTGLLDHLTSSHPPLSSPVLLFYILYTNYKYSQIWDHHLSPIFLLSLSSLLISSHLISRFSPHSSQLNKEKKWSSCTWMRNGSCRRKVAETTAAGEYALLEMRAAALLVQLVPPSLRDQRAQERRGAAVPAPDRALDLCRADALIWSRNRELVST